MPEALLDLTLAKLNKINGGVYRCEIDGVYHLLSGKFGSVLKEAQVLSDFSDPIIEYLSDNGEEGVHWEPVDIKNFRHYHGDQQKQLLTWMYRNGCRQTEYGFLKMSRSTGISASRLRDSMRNPASNNHSPFSDTAMLYLRHMLDG